MDWARILAYVTGTVNQELLGRNEYLAAENRILKAQLKGRPDLSDAERGALGEIGHRLGRKVLADIATVARPDTILGWYRKLVARKFDGSKARQYPGRPRIKREVEELILRMASENRDWGYDRIAGALANLGHEVSDQTVGNVLRRHGLPPAPERKRTSTWVAFVRTHAECLRRALGQIGQGGVPVEGDPVRRALLAADAERVCRTFPCRAKSPGEGQHPAVSSEHGPRPRGVGAVSRTIGRAAALLSSRGGVMAQRPDQLFGHTGFDPARTCRGGPRDSDTIAENYWAQVQQQLKLGDRNLPIGR